METFVIASLLLFVASVWDLHSREVPDWVSYTLIGSMFCIALYNQQYYSILAGVLLFVIGWLMVYGSVWGGADAKLLPVFAMVSVPFSLEYYLILPILFTVGAVYGILWVGIISLLKFKKLYAWLNTQSKYWVILLLFLASSFFVNWMLGSLLLLLVSFTVLTSFLNTVEFVQNVTFNKVVPGDWLAEPIKVGHHSFNGLVTEKDCRKIHLLGFQGELTTVDIRYGIPFVPAFFLTYVLYYFKDYFLTLM